MASTPTTKSQVQAYRFVLRRMESALVRKDAVMLHDPMGSHKRANLAGVILACVGVIGFLVWGLFGGKGTVPEPGAIVIGKESGSVYVVTADQHAQKRLIPMLNMASAKLLVMAQGGGQGGQAAEPQSVKEAALAEFPRGPRTGMVNAPVYLPDAGNTATPSWAVCDVGKVNQSLNDSQVEGATKVETTVVGGDPNNGAPLGPKQSLYVQDQASGKKYLIYVPAQQDAKAVRAEVDGSDGAVTQMYGLTGATPRAISTNMLNAIPSVAKLQVPRINGDDDPVQYMGGSGQYQVGDVLSMTVPGQPDAFFVLLKDGKQQISEGAAAVLHAAKSGSRDIPNATNALTEARDAKNEHLPVDTFPQAVPKPVGFQQWNTSCLSWNNVNGNHDISVTVKNVGADAPAKDGAVKLAQSDGPGPKVDYFFMPAGKAAVVRAAPNENGAASGPIFLVSDQGVQYGIKDVATAQGLGVINSDADIKGGPAWITRVLPAGDFLDPAQASFVYDSIPVPPGGVNRPPPNAQGGS